jgi:O-antigen/teichoic acid export membrane protein
LLGVLFAVPICLGAWYFASGPRTSLIGAVVLLGLLLPAGVYTELVAAAVRGFGKSATSLVGEMLVRPVVAGTLLGVFVFLGMSIASPQAIGAYLAGTLGASILSTYVLLKTIPAASSSAPAKLKRSWSRAAGLMMLANGFLAVLYSLDVLMVGALHSTTSSGIYNVATKLAILVLFMMNAAQVVAGPMFAAAHAHGRPEELRRVVRTFNFLSALAGIPIACLIAVLSPWLLAAFGPEFGDARYPLLVLLAMQALNALTGPVGLLLGMTGRQKDLAMLLGCAVLLNAALNWWLIPTHGALGAAWASFISHAAWKIAGVVHIHRTLRIDCSIMDGLRRSSIAGA